MQVVLNSKDPDLWFETPMDLFLGILKANHTSPLVQVLVDSKFLVECGTWKCGFNLAVSEAASLTICSGGGIENEDKRQNDFRSTR